MRTLQQRNYAIFYVIKNEPLGKLLQYIGEGQIRDPFNKRRLRSGEQK